MKKKLIVLSGFVLGLAPVVALATHLANPLEGHPTECTSGTVFGMLCIIGKFLNSVIPVLIVLGVVFFIWGVVSYVIGSDEEAKKNGREKMIYGIIGLAVIVALWGLVNILVDTFEIETTGTVPFPTVVIPPQ